MKWPDDLADWPMADVSRKVLCRPHRWHVQDAGTGDTILLIHGAGGATQSWRGIFPLLAQTHRVIAIDLPGQGFTEIGARGRCGLRHMAEDIAALMDKENIQPKTIIGHAAGAATVHSLLVAHLSDLQDAVLTMPNAPGTVPDIFSPVDVELCVETVDWT